jgi:hypothetical protein
MKLLLSCFECKKEILGAPVDVEIEDDGVYVFVCGQGHRTVHTLTNPKFEVLFEMGLLAFDDGYTREAVATMAASVEEFYRFFVKCVFAKRGLFEKDRYYEAVKFWKLISRAEPQLGAFAAFYFLELEKCPSYPDSTSIEFRNNVIHRGKIPKANEVTEYGDKILRFMIPVYRECRKDFAGLTATGLDMVAGLKKRNEKPSASSSYPTAVSQLVLSEQEPSLSNALEYVRKYKGRFFTP